ncbi:hypothetical protein [Photobacterium damselae]|uniref:hypothetical protein n=1 Tax=Photobacterium damselae TaxID=38293 RepID=UPI00370C4505
MSNRISFSNSWSQWESWYRPTDRNHETPDYDYQALWGMLKMRYGINIPSGSKGQIVIDFDKHNILSVHVANDVTEKKKEKKKTK